MQVTHLAHEPFFEPREAEETVPDNHRPDHVAPTQSLRELSQFIERSARAVEGADQRADTGPGDDVDRDAAALQRLQHSEVRHAADDAAAQGKTDFFAR